VRRRFTLLLGSAVALVAAAPAAAADVEVLGRDALVWDPPHVKINVGETVRWTFQPGQFHDLAATSPNWAGFQSPPGKPAPPAEYTFAAQGTYSFVCQLHPKTMLGTVTVGNPPPPPLPPLSEQPFDNDGGALGALETGGRDRTAPKLRAMRVRRVGGGARLSFRVSERSRVTVRFTRGGRVFKTVRVNASGRYRGTIRDAKRLRAGRYRVELRAVDIAGNRSAVRRARVTLGS
jgi:plastocyanin